MPEPALEPKPSVVAEMKTERAPRPKIPDHQLLRRIGQGAYGEVWLARNALGFYRAVKIVTRRNFDCDRTYAREFAGLQKFEPVSRLHESQVDILHVGCTGDCFYYVMELADDAAAERSGGMESWSDAHADQAHHALAPALPHPERYVPRTLQHEMTWRGRLPFLECTRIGLSLTTALINLHKHGLVHRDIKPANVIFVGGRPKLADIGLVSSTAGSHSFVGTEGFIPPEGPGTPQGDLYSLGKLLYEISTGRDRQDFPAPPDDLQAMPERAAWLEFNEIILRACEHLPRERYRSAEEMHADLAVLQGGKSVTHLRRIERRLKVVSRLGLASLLVALLAAAAYYQANRTGREVRNQMAQLNEANGIRLMDEGDLFGSLLWFARTVQLSRGDPAGETNDRFRFEAIRRQCPTLKQIFFHQGPVTGAEFSPDGRRLVTVSADHTARVWDVETGEAVTPPLVHADQTAPEFNREMDRIVLPAHAHGGEVNHAEFSPGGRLIVTASNDGTAVVWSAATGKPAAPPLRHRSSVVWAAFSPDGRRVATASWDNTARVWEASSGRPVTPPLPHADHVLYVAFSPDGQRLVTASADHTARIWEAASGKPVGVPLRHGDKVRSAVFSPDGRRIGTASEDHTARLWDAATGAALTGPLRHSKSVYFGVFSPEGTRFATASEDASVQVWAVATGEVTDVRLLHRSMVRSVAFSPDGRWLVTASGDCSARVWNAATGTPASPILKHARNVHSARFSPDGRRVVTVSSDQTARVWDWAAPDASDPIMQHQAEVNYATFSPDGHRIVTASSDGAAEVWDATTGQPVTPPLRHDGRVIFATFHPDSRAVVAYGTAVTVQLWDAGTGQRLGLPLTHAGDPSGAWLSPNGRGLVTSEDRAARTWNARNGEPVGPPPRSYWVDCVAFSPGGRLIATGSGNTEIPGVGEARFWDARTGKRVGPVMRTLGAVVDISFSPDGARLLTASADASIEARSAQVWEVGSGRPAAPPLPHADGVASARFSPDGRWVVTASEDHTARVWDARTSRPITPPLWHERQVLSAVFSHDGRRVLTTCEDGAARIWDAATGEPMSPPMRHRAGIVRGEFSPDGHSVVTASRDHTARIWRLPKAYLSIADATLVAEVLTGQRIDETGGVVPLEAAALEREWRKFRGLPMHDPP